MLRAIDFAHCDLFHHSPWRCWNWRKIHWPYLRIKSPVTNKIFTRYSGIILKFCYSNLQTNAAVKPILRLIDFIRMETDQKVIGLHVDAHFFIILWSVLRLAISVRQYQYCVLLIALFILFVNVFIFKKTYLHVQEILSSFIFPFE